MCSADSIAMHGRAIRRCLSPHRLSNLSKLQGQQSQVWNTPLAFDAAHLGNHQKLALTVLHRTLRREDAARVRELVRKA
jgi:hypothetical protein